MKLENATVGDVNKSIRPKHTNAALKAYPYPDDDSFKEIKQQLDVVRQAFACGMAYGEHKEKERIKKKLIKAEKESDGPEHNAYYALRDVIDKL